MRKWIAVIAVGLAALWCPQVRAQTFPNTYAAVSSISYNPNIGSAGTLTFYYQFTGTTQQSPMCGSSARHTPKMAVTLFRNGTQMAQGTASGNGIAPCVQMNQTLSVSFDLGSDQCTLSLFADGTCTLNEQGTIWCTIAGQFFSFLPETQFNIAQFWERAAVGTGGPPYTETDNCNPGYQPADWIQPTQPNGDYWFGEAVVYRIKSAFESFTGLPWKMLWHLNLTPPGVIQDSLDIDLGSNSTTGNCTCYDCGHP